jgi:hypothetical protein
MKKGLYDLGRVLAFLSICLFIGTTVRDYLKGEVFWNVGTAFWCLLFVISIPMILWGRESRKKKNGRSTNGSITMINGKHTG